MEKKSFRFNTGVTVSIDNSQITASDDSGSDKMETANLDSFHYEEHIEPRITPAALYLIPLVVGFFLLLIGAFAGQIFKVFGYILLVVSAIGFIFTFFDALLHTGLARGIIAKYFSYKGFAVTIGNKSGNNILFYTNLDEVNKIKKLGNYLDDLKALKSDINDSIESQKESTSNIDLGQIRKLGELLNEGLISQEEFDNKKKQILGV